MGWFCRERPRLFTAPERGTHVMEGRGIEVVLNLEDPGLQRLGRVTSLNRYSRLRDDRPFVVTLIDVVYGRA
jgi:hypothetical protein